MSKYVIFRPKIITNLTQEIQDHVNTNLQIWELVKLWDLFKNVTHENIINRVLDNSPSGLLVDMITEEGAYILTPRSGDSTSQSSSTSTPGYGWRTRSTTLSESEIA